MTPIFPSDHSVCRHTLQCCMRCVKACDTVEICFVALYPPFRARGFTYLHDPVATILAPDLVTWRTLRVDVEMSGRLTAGMTLMREPSDAAPANARVALQVNAARFEEWFLSRVAVMNQT